jgi:hypothetical protein
MDFGRSRPGADLTDPVPGNQPDTRSVDLRAVTVDPPPNAE